MKKYFAIFVIALLCGCTGNKGTITAFNNNIAPTGKTYYIEPTAEQQKDLSFAEYAEYMVNALDKHNYKRVMSKASADYVASISYGLKDPISKVDGDDEVVTSKTIYTAFFKLSFVNRTNRKPIYNSETKIMTKESSFLPISRCVIDLAFVEFPNKNKTTKTIKYDKDACFIETDSEDKSSLFSFF